MIVDFIVPVYKTTRQLKSKMSEMQRKMEEQQRAGFQTPKYEPKPADTNKEYIDYEEVRWGQLTIENWQLRILY